MAQSPFFSTLRFDGSLEVGSMSAMVISRQQSAEVRQLRLSAAFRAKELLAPLRTTNRQALRRPQQAVLRAGSVDIFTHDGTCIVNSIGVELISGRNVRIVE